MRKKRLLSGNFCRPIYHITSRCCNADFYLDAESKSKLVMLIHKYADFCGVEVFSWCVMTNHFHILVDVPACDPEAITDGELLRRLRLVAPEPVFERTTEALARAAALGGAAGEALRRKARAPHLRRMGVLAAFVKGIKQSFTQWFNKRRDREGTAWEGRFRSTLVGGDSPEGTAAVARVVAAYIDLNPVRAGIVTDPGEFVWSGYGAAMRGDPLALRGIGRLMARRAEGRAPADAGQLAAYRLALFEAGNETNQNEGGGRAGIAAAAVAELRRAASRSTGPAVHRRLPALSRARAVGDAGFVGLLEKSGLLGDGLGLLGGCALGALPAWAVDPPG
jgi:putative transposase